MVRLVLFALLAASSALGQGFAGSEPGSVFGIASVKPGSQRIHNLSGYRRSAWAEITVPWTIDRWLRGGSVAFQVGMEMLPACRSHTMGRLGAVYHVHVRDLLPRRAVEGRLVPAHDAPGFSLSPWIALGTLVPEIVIQTGNQVLRLVPKVLPLPTDGNAYRAWRLRGRVGMLVFEGVWRVPSFEDTVEVEFTLTQSDPRAQQMSLRVDRLTIRTPQYLHIDLASTLGLRPPRRALDAWELDLIRDPLEIGDGQQLPHFTGALLCLPPISTSRLLASNDPETRRRLESLVARYDGGPVRGLANWEGAYLAFGVLPEMRAGDQTRREAAWQEARGYLTRPQTLFGDRPRGAPKDTGWTGSFEDFGACKGIEVFTWGDVRMIPFLRWSLGEPLRPVHLREANGRRVLQAEHPFWRTWAQRTHYHGSVSTDRLGKPYPEPFNETHGWTGKWDQKASANNLFAVYAATGSILLQDHIRDVIEVELANVRNFEQPGGAPRALGNRMLANANRYLCTGDKRMLDLILVQARWFADYSPGSPFWKDPKRTLRPLGTTTDLRALQGTNGSAVPAVVMWEHGMALTGLAGAFHTAVIALINGWDHVDIASLDRLRQLTKEVASLLVRHAYFQEGGRWKWASYVRWRGNGKAPQADAYLGGGRKGEVMVDTAGYFGAWMISGLIYARTYAQVLGLDADVRTKLDQIVCWHLASNGGSGPADPHERVFWATARY